MGRWTRDGGYRAEEDEEERRCLLPATKDRGIVVWIGMRIEVSFCFVIFCFNCCFLLGLLGLVI